ncbi:MULTISPECIES: hypothetical protein [Hymenobacter]|uniref:XRE family transcriptional regulator n=1 Tax=Hymenobacter guriensis TaxID=2793065 RepID=A0ABS0L8D0_9BACT|nr:MULTISPECIES: hypothetical protein [Hymenobacter]MBG8556326.1 hypothetical protein [Hymenobacter guriensis]MCR5890442.1 hypothetical protein [Hymenobacter sp. J193]
MSSFLPLHNLNKPFFMPKPSVEFPGQAVPIAPNARTFAEMVDSKKAPVRTITDRLGMTFRTYLKRRKDPAGLSLAEVFRLADWLAEAPEKVLAELMMHTVLDSTLLGPGITRHPNGIDRTGTK